MAEESQTKTRPLAMIIEADFNESSGENPFIVVMEDLRQALAQHTGSGDIEVKMVHLYVDDAAKDLMKEARIINKETG